MTQMQLSLYLYRVTLSLCFCFVYKTISLPSGEALLEAGSLRYFI